MTVASKNCTMMNCEVENISHCGPTKPIIQERKKKGGKIS